MKIFKALVSLMLTCSTAAAEEATMFVFDASGSMWGQIEGRSKIELAREAFENIEERWQSSSAGLIAYGHRRKGDCRDIEMIVPVSENGFDSVTAAISNLTPKGKTPLSSAVKQAAEHLKYQENAATVILFSDGVETCEADPCALASQLENLGIDFTAHVIGFGIASDADRENLQCIADNTGGVYLDAQDASSLKDALTQLADAPDAARHDEPAGRSSLRLVLQLQEGTVRPDQVSLRAKNPDTGEKQLIGKMSGAAEVLSGLSAQLGNGRWLIEAISPEGEGAVDVVLTGEPVEVSVPFAAKQVSFSVVDNGPYLLGTEQSFFVMASGTPQSNAEYTVQLYDPRTGERVDSEYRFGSDGPGLTWHTFASPVTPGTYQVQVIQGDEIISQTPVDYVVTHRPIWTGELDGPPGGKLAAGVTGDLYYSNSFVLKQNGAEVQSTTLEDTITGDGLFLTLPDQPGAYELSYLHRNSSGDRIETHLATLRVGDVTLADDPDAVEAPTETLSNLGDTDGDVPHDDALYGVWTLTTQEEATPLGMLQLSPGPDNATATGSIFLQNEELTRMTPADIEIAEITLHREGAEGPIYSLQFEDGEGAQKTSVLLTRPHNWDGKSQELSGVLVTNNYRAQFKVKAFK